MVRGVNYSRSGLESNAKALEIVTNNLANSNTTGFKRSIALTESVKDAGEQPKGRALAGPIIDFSEGELKYTGNKLDLAIKGKGFFTVQADQGIFYTRQGNFQVDGEGFLTTPDGYYVLGDGGPIPIDNDASITEQGEVVVNGEIVDRLAITEITDVSKLKAIGKGLFASTDNTVAVNTKDNFVIKAGYLEGSNVEPLEEMVSLIEIYRRFEANQKALKAQDESLGKAVNDVGRVG